MKIAEGLYIVAGGESGFGLTNEYDCTVYLIQTNTGFVLIDAGCGLEEERITAYIEYMGFNLKNCKAILITHAHADHIGGIKALAGPSQAPVYAWKESASYISEGDIEKMSIPEAIAAGVYPENYSVETCHVQSIDKKTTLTIDGYHFNVLPTPGHSSGHCCYLMEKNDKRLLFAGDCIFLGGKISLQNIWDCDIKVYANSIISLKELQIDGLLPAHYGFTLSKGQKHIDYAIKTFQQLGIPQNAGYFI